ncbi:MAG: copper amine oxidase N-terminal domain-containing protein, partial [Clostridiaceae bacterium]|nr:copper amine oxidase N-terminal domain-containing protein [Clostridiaceae bacterium]
MKRNILFGLAAALCLTGMASAKAASAPTVWLDGEQMTFEVAPVIENDRTMVPYRAIFEKLGYQVGWDADTRSVTAVKGSTTMKLTIGSKTVTVNGGTVTSDTAPVIRQDRTLVPLRLVSEYSGCDVLWDKDTRTVAMYHKQAKNAMSEKLGCV